MKKNETYKDSARIILTYKSEEKNAVIVDKKILFPDTYSNKHELDKTELYVVNMHSENHRERIKKRHAWYSFISKDSFRPSFTTELGVQFFSKEDNISEEVSYKKIESLVNDFIIEKTEPGALEKEKIISSLLKACAQISRYLPEFEEKKPTYFIDAQSSKIGVIFKGNGTLTLLIGETSEVFYSYAQKMDSGTVRITGTAKLTNYLKNSKNIWKILSLQG
ncbi:hypothetical protein ACMSIO_02825 [Pseudomonas benzopyrenica]|uniref:hypothetical protein n=1 Tax=Pseudomonas benzopyrenica TaxID=2993566 RepID=UPI0039C4E209